VTGSQALVQGDVVTESQALAPATYVATNVEQWNVCSAVNCMVLDCCCWSTFYTEPHPDYPNHENVTRERHCVRGTLPEQFVLVKDPGYVGSLGQQNSLMANQNPDFSEGRDLCCVVSVDDVTTKASADTIVEETPVFETTAPPLLVSDEVVEAPVEETPPPPEETPPVMESHSGPFHGPHNHTNASNHSNHSNASMAPNHTLLAHARRASPDDGNVGSEFEKLEEEADGGFDYRDLPRLQAEASAVLASRGHLRAAR